MSKEERSGNGAGQEQGVAQGGPRRFGRPQDRPLIPAGGGIPPMLRMVALFCVIIVGVVGWFLMREKVPAADLYTGPAGEAAERIAVRLADEADILANAAGEPAVFRFASNRQVLVLDFGSLREQGLMLNRVAALVEKIGLPRDRVLNDAELAAAIARSGATVETYYLGHDYPSGRLAEFFTLADRDGIRLRPQEEWLRQLLRQEGFLEAGARKALIAVPRVGAGHGIDAAMRASVLRHELSHAEFFTNRSYAGWVHGFWRDGLGEEGRAAFRRYFAEQGYDAGDEELMANEMQAHLMHTADIRLFGAEALGVGMDTLSRWQAGFLLGMPNGWLRDACIQTLPSAGSMLRRPRRRPWSSRVARGVRASGRVLRRHVACGAAHGVAGSHERAGLNMGDIADAASNADAGPCGGQCS